MAKRTPRPADVAYDRVRAICLGFSAADEKLSHGAPSFHVRGKHFLTFVDDHHGNGRLAVWLKATLAEQRRLVALAPSRFFVPPYVGIKGWVGAHVDEARADWIELAMLVEEAWRMAAPPRAMRVEEPPRVLTPAPRRVTTDAKVARAALERLRALCLALPGAELVREASHAAFRVRTKVFCYFLDNHHGDGIVGACVRSEKARNARLVAESPARYFSPAYIGPRGYLGIRLDRASVDWDDVTQRVTASYERVAPKRPAAHDAPTAVPRAAAKRASRARPSPTSR